MELKRVLVPIWKWLWLILLCAALAAGLSYWNSMRLPRIYRTSTTLLVGQLTENPNPQAQDFYASQQLARSYVELVRRKPVLSATIDTLGLQADWISLSSQVFAENVGGTQLMQITVVDTNPKRAQLIANEVANQLILQSPTTPGPEQEQHRQFVNEQLTNLKNNIDSTNRQIQDLEKRLALETSARAIQEIQGQISALQQRALGWQTTYASLLNNYHGNRTNYLTIVEPAILPTVPISPNVPMNVLLATAIGALLGIGAAYLLEFIDNTVKTAEDIEHHAGLATLGMISRIHIGKAPTDSLITLHHPRSQVAEAYRVLRTNLQFASINLSAPRILVTSANPSEGKTTVISNLAVTLAQSGKRVILLDTDLRRPMVHRIFGASNRQGLTNLLLDPALSLDDILVEVPLPHQPSDQARLWVLTSGPIPPNPADLLESERMREVVEKLQARADLLLFDSPPVLAVADSTILGVLCGGALLVVDAGHTRIDALKRSRDTLQRTGLKVIGVSLNKLRARQAGAYYYYYSHTEDGEPQRRRKKSGRRGPLAQAWQSLFHRRQQPISTHLSERTSHLSIEQADFAHSPQPERTTGD